MGRKRNQGKARRAAKAKAREEAEEEGRNNNDQATADVKKQALATLMQQLPCKHGVGVHCLSPSDISFQLVFTFRKEFCGARKEDVNAAGGLSTYLVAAHNATWDEFAEVWNDCISFCA